MRHSLAFALGLGLTAHFGCGSPSFNDFSDGPGDGGGGNDAGVADAAPATLFSFFVTSLQAMRDLSGSENGFGGNLGGLDGADGICQEIATGVGEGGKTWRAFLSVAEGPEGGPVHAIDRVGQGPWYDRNERLLSEDAEGLLRERPDGDAQVANDLPDENGAPLEPLGDSHDIMTASDEQGHLSTGGGGWGGPGGGGGGECTSYTCEDWTSDVGPGSEECVMLGHGWPAMSGTHWIASHHMRGCAPGVNLVQDGPGSGDCVGCGGGWGAIYCFAVTE